MCEKTTARFNCLSIYNYYKKSVITSNLQDVSKQLAKYTKNTVA